MRALHRMKLLLALLTWTTVSTGWAQTNVTFQNCRPGDLVKVKCEHPLLVLGKAMLLEIGSNTVTVCTANDRFKLAQSEVILLPLERRTAPAAPAAEAGNPADALASLAKAMPAGDPVKSLALVQEQVLGKYQNDPGHAKAGAYYQTTMNGVLSGQVNQDELVRQAKKILKDCDEYAPERKKDPQFEEQIKALRDFVRRSEAGEKIDFKTNVQ